MKASENKNVLVSGASIAGLSTAWCLYSIGDQVTVVELAGAPRTAGAAIDLNPPTVVIAKRMGLYESFIENRLSVNRIEYKNTADATDGVILVNEGREI